MLLRTRTTITPGWEDLLKTHGIDSIEGVYQLGSGKVITRSNSSEVHQLDLGVGSAARTVFVKKYWIRKTSQLWKGMFRGTFFGRSKVRREFSNLIRLRQSGLDAPEPVAFGEERYGRWLLRSFLISCGIPNSVPLDVMIRRNLQLGEFKRSRRELLNNLARYVQRMHQFRFVHQDLFWRNILISGQNLEHFFLIDAHEGHRWPPGSGRRNRAKDLAALDSAATHYFRQTERMRFFLVYRGHSRLTAQDKDLIRLALRLAAPLRDRQLRRVRKL